MTLNFPFLSTRPYSKHPNRRMVPLLTNKSSQPDTDQDSEVGRVGWSSLKKGVLLKEDFFILLVTFFSFLSFTPFLAPNHQSQGHRHDLPSANQLAPLFVFIFFFFIFVRLKYRDSWDRGVAG
ncbi:hypothetical protein F5H01DRAFT_55243 [Linnemannia elongata]|nr:hypothetical protein F5H01DRAFT_55243 [Linnemannia elongata]